MKADKIAIEPAKTGKVTAVVAVMSIFSRKRCKLQSANLGNEKSSCQKKERADFSEENTRRLRSLSRNSRKGWIPKKLASKLKKLELKCTSLKLNSKKTHSDHAIMPAPSVSSKLIEKQNIHILNNLFV